MSLLKFSTSFLFGVLSTYSVHAAAATGTTVKPVHSGLCMDVSGNSTADGATLIQWNCQGSDNQLFTFTAKSGGQYQLISKSSGKCVTVVSTANGLLLQQATCGTGAAQLFKITTVKAGVVNVISVLNNNCLDVPGISTVAGTQIGAYTCNGQTNQQFTATVDAVVAPTPTPVPPSSSVQPPPMNGGADKFALDVNCTQWDASQANIDECAKDMDLIKGLGVGTLRLGFSWDQMVLADGFTLDPKKVTFVKGMMNQARIRGMKIVVQVGLLAPSSSYKCAATQNPPAASSQRLDFCDASFTKYAGALMDVILPFTADIELFNEINWNYNAADPAYGDPKGQAGYILSRSKTLYGMMKQIMNSKQVNGLQAVLHSAGISYFYDSSLPNNGWKPPTNMLLIDAQEYFRAMGNYTSSAGSPLNASIDVVDIHPYFGTGDYVLMIRSFAKTISSLVPGGKKALWLTETNGGDGDAGMTATFNQLKILMDDGTVQKAFWYVIRNGDFGNGEADGYSIYDANRNLIRPQLAAAIKAYTATVPSSQRFLSGTYIQPIK
jgi:hypothetical protein